MRILGLSKTYGHLPFGLKSDTDLKALKNVFLEVAESELMALLGHNGAGKTTMLNILTGIVHPTDGDAKICGMKLSTDMNEIRKILGVVPQFDILWQHITAREHMEIFMEIKEVPR